MGACAKCSLSGERSIFHFQMLKWLHPCDEIRQLRWIAKTALCPPTFAWMQLGMAHILGLPFCVFALLLFTCAYLFSLQMALTLQNTQQKAGINLEGINLNGSVSSSAWMQQNKETQYFMIINDWRTSHVTGADWQIKAGVTAVSSGKVTCEHQELPCLSLKLKPQLHEKMPDLRWNNVEEWHWANPALCLQRLWCWLCFNQASSNDTMHASCCEDQASIMKV